MTIFQYYNYSNTTADCTSTFNGHVFWMLQYFLIVCSIFGIVVNAVFLRVIRRAVGHLDDNIYILLCNLVIGFLGITVFMSIFSVISCSTKLYYGAPNYVCLIFLGPYSISTQQIFLTYYATCLERMYTAVRCRQASTFICRLAIAFSWLYGFASVGRRFALTPPGNCYCSPRADKKTPFVFIFVIGAILTVPLLLYSRFVSFRNLSRYLDTDSTISLEQRLFISRSLDICRAVLCASPVFALNIAMPVLFFVLGPDHLGFPNSDHLIPVIIFYYYPTVLPASIVPIILIRHSNTLFEASGLLHYSGNIQSPPSTEEPMLLQATPACLPNLDCHQVNLMEPADPQETHFMDLNDLWNREFDKRKGAAKK